MRSLFFSFALIFLCTPTFAETLSADDIMQRLDDRYTGDTSITESTLVLIDQKGRERVRQLKLFGIDKPEVEKSVMFFLSPADVQGTAYMTYDWEDNGKEDDSWLYLPAMEKIKRVASSEESGSFMGSDFSYTDINGIDIEDFNYTMEKDSDVIDGHDCWVVKSEPKNEDIIDKTGYTGSTLWVRKDNFMNVQSIINVKKGKRVKYFSAKDIEEIQGVWTAKTLQMVTTRNDKLEHSSVFRIDSVQYNQNVDETMFDTQAMQRGL